MVERGLRRELANPGPSSKRRRRVPIQWVTVREGLPPDLDVSDRAAMHDWLRNQDSSPDC